jgi:hypothetical protein
MFVVLIVLPLVLVLIVLAIVLAMRPHVRRTLYGETGLDEWRTVAAGLSWRDRWALYRANAAGRAAPPHLAAHAVQRGEVVVACGKVNTAPSSRLPQVWRVLGVFAVVMCALNVALLVAGARGFHNWLQVVNQGFLAVLALGMPVWQRRQVVKASRSVERNRELVALQHGEGLA